MKTFLKRITGFSVLTFLIYALLSVIYNYYLLKGIDEVHQLRPETQILILGDSHPECAINDLEFPIFENRARSAEIYFLSYFKLRNILEHPSNQKLDAICLVYNYFSLAKRRQDLFSDEKQLKKSNFFFNRYVPIWRHTQCFPQHYGYQVTRSLLSVLIPSYSINLEGVKDIIKYRKAGWAQLAEYKGSFLSKHIEAIDKTKIAIELKKLEKAKAKRQPGEYQGSELEEKMLRLMLDLAKEHNIPVVLINTPEHPIQVENTDPRAIAYHLKVVEDLKQEYGIHFLNYHDMELPENCFYDFGHLNVDGANRFTPILLEDLKKLKLVSPE